MWQRVAVTLILAATLGVVGWQFAETKRLRAELAQVREQVVVPDAKPAPANVAEPRPMATPAPTLGTLPARVAALEESVAQLTKASEYLMSRGQLPLSSNKIETLFATLRDPNTSERDRLQTLRALRRSGAFNDEAIQFTLDWLSKTTNANLREDLVGQLEGTTNALARQPLLTLASADPSPDVRESAVEALRRFAGDPQVDALLWNLLRTDPDGGVREQAEEALSRGAMTETRAAAMRVRALDPQSTLDERLVAVRALQNAPGGAPDVVAAIAQLAQSTQDSAERAKVFRAFDGTSEPQMKLPLVYGLQDPNPLVRQEAADALSGFKSDPVIVEWLKHISENDSDPRVRREAAEALRDRR